ncbi:type VI secretion system protein ImpB [Allofrancisella inopinata]|uniref:Type VI secretion system contractile sheath small subunit n=1 Tax=Allofrancisella inopinata TaxID=1085647 RepID=A0AAE6YJ10_9GAMM|nr:type VI secretion system contractile sheath small subunit [Allofrancisella inopinata]QIV96416.1 type VI secretion system contractile sheath small subunit [Allofrancisella inopinata]TDT73399.1 type VI secretion system protein ImpB [Allofrancisella inopinata]
MSVNETIPKSRVNITYDMDVSGTKQAKELPLKQLVIGDFSQGSSKEKSLELANRKVYEIESNNLDSVMQEMGIQLDINVENHVEPASGVLNVKIPLKSMKSFNPNSIAQNIPELSKLLKVKELLKEYISLIDNNRKFRNLVNNLSASPESLESLIQQLKLDDNSGYRIENSPENKEV